jgi:DNA-binding winged helix-turn-helix (wHTH) protein
MSAPGGERVGHGLRFHDLVFDPQLLGAVRDDGAELRLTRQERALLREFVDHPHRLLNRDQLLTALSGETSEISDRNVDFIVNRLRRKLHDPARKPRFIATQYGEGYIWIAEPSTPAPGPGLLVLGPVLGAPDVVESGEAQAFAQRLQRALEQRTAPGHVAMRPQWRGEASDRLYRFSLEISLRREGVALQAVLTLRQEPGHVAVSVRRLTAIETAGDTEAGALAAALMAAIWRSLAVRHDDLVAPTDAPLEVRLHDAAQLLSTSDENWTKIAPKLAADRAADPEDPHTAIIWATYLHSRLMRAQAGDPSDPDTYTPVEDEIEGLVFASLLGVRSEPAFALSAASLLVGVHRGHEDFAESLVAGVLAQSPAFAMAFPVLGQIEAKRGDLSAAVKHYDEALGLCEPGTEAEIYLLVHKARTLIAGDERDAAQAVFERITEIKPLAGRQLGLVYLRPGEESLTPDLRRRLDRLTLEAARRSLGFQYFIVARRFGVAAHRLNIMAGPMDHLVRRFGRAVVPPAVAEALAEAPA